MIGRTLSTYRVVAKLGAGGMGEVYRARDEKLDRDVAVKVLPIGLLGDEAARNRFRKEAKALSRLTHPHVATLLDFGNADGMDYLVLELVPGRTLGEVLQDGPLAAKDVVRLGTQLARGLIAAHEQGIVHRDLKPSNLCLTGDGLLKILDFGVAHLAPATSPGTRDKTDTETAAGKIMGSPPYMSPEQMLGKRVDARSDVYSAGACLYELATALKPFGERSGASLTDAILHEVPGLASHVNATMPKGLDSVIAKAMDKDPELRYQSAGELLVDLERLQQGSEAGVSSSGRGATARASARRRRAWRWALASGAAMVLLGVAWTLWPRRPPRLLGSRTLTRGLLANPNFSWASDGTRVYYTNSVVGPTRFYQMPIAGGEPSELDISLRDGGIHAYLSGIGTLLIFGSETSDPRDRHEDGAPLWLANVSSGELRRLGNLSAWGAAVSPDETHLALVSGAQGATAISLSKADGSDLRKLLAIPQGVGGIAWAPDGKRLRFTSSGPAGHDKELWIWETSIQGEPPRPLWPGLGGSWNRDGRDFVFFRWRERAVGPPGADLWMAPESSWSTAGGAPIQLSFGPLLLWDPRFVPNRRELYAWGDLLRGELLRYDSATSRPEPYLGGVSGHFADPSPDGQWVAFVSYPEDELWKSRPDGSQKVRLTRPGTQAGFPRWSPDGRELSFVGFEPGEPGGSVRRVSADGTREEVLARPPFASYWDACWLPEGEGLVFSRIDNAPGILRLDLRTKELRTVPGAEKLLNPKCSRQGHLLARDPGSDRGFYVLWRGRNDWVHFDSGALAYPNWTRDGRAVIGLTVPGQSVDRFDFAARRWTTLVDLSDTPLVTEWGAPWVGLAADDSPLFLRARGTRDLYAFDWEAP